MNASARLGLSILLAAALGAPLLTGCVGGQCATDEECEDVDRRSEQDEPEDVEDEVEVDTAASPCGAATMVGRDKDSGAYICCHRGSCSLY